MSCLYKWCTGITQTILHKSSDTFTQLAGPVPLVSVNDRLLIQNKFLPRQKPKTPVRGCEMLPRMALTVYKAPATITASLPQLGTVERMADETLSFFFWFQDPQWKIEKGYKAWTDLDHPQIKGSFMVQFNSFFYIVFSSLYFSLIYFHTVKRMIHLQDTGVLVSASQTKNKVFVPWRQGIWSAPRRPWWDGGLAALRTDWENTPEIQAGSEPQLLEPGKEEGKTKVLRKHYIDKEFVFYGFLNTSLPWITTNNTACENATAYSYIEWWAGGNSRSSNDEVQDQHGGSR